MSKPISVGTVHDHIPKDFATMLMKHERVFLQWQDITPLARNEFLCWILDAKKPETRVRRIAIAQDKLSRGERRPCCWMGCIHRTDKPLSPSVRGILA